MRLPLPRACTLAPVQTRHHHCRQFKHLVADPHPPVRSAARRRNQLTMVAAPDTTPDNRQESPQPRPKWVTSYWVRRAGPQRRRRTEKSAERAFTQAQIRQPGLYRRAGKAWGSVGVPLGGCDGALYALSNTKTISWRRRSRLPAARELNSAAQRELQSSQEFSLFWRNEG